MQISLISSSFEPIQDQNHSETKVQFKPFHIPGQLQRRQESDFRISWFWNRQRRRSDLSPQSIKTTSHRCNHDSEAILMHKQCDTALFNPLCIYQDHAVLIIHHPTCTHTHKTALKPKHTHLDKQTQAERERVELFWQMFACYHLRHSAQTNQLVIQPCFIWDCNYLTPFVSFSFFLPCLLFFSPCLRL